MSTCHVAAFRDTTTGLWGWQCLTCPEELTGYESVISAEAEAEHHRSEVAAPVDPRKVQADDLTVQAIRAGHQPSRQDELVKLLGDWAECIRRGEEL